MRTKKTLYELGDAAHQTLDTLLIALRTAVKQGYLHIFEHAFDSASLRLDDLEANRALLEKAKNELNAFNERAHADTAWQACYHNIDFTLNSIDRMAHLLNDVQLIGDINKVTTSLENVNNNLHVILDEMLVKCHYEG